MDIQNKLKQAKNLKEKIDSVKTLKAELKALNEEIIAYKKAEFNAFVIAAIDKVKEDKNKVEHLISMSRTFAKKEYKDFEHCLQEFEEKIQELKQPKSTSNDATNSAGQTYGQR